MVLVLALSGINNASLYNLRINFIRDYRQKMQNSQALSGHGCKEAGTQSVTLYIGYSHAYGVEEAKGTASFSTETNADSIVVPAVAALYQRIVISVFAICRICLCCNSVVADQGVLQLTMFEDTTKQIRNKAIQETMLSIKARYGKNAILKGMNYEEAATGREQNMQIGGHKSGTT